jgi:hypothetical protein
MMICVRDDCRTTRVQDLQHLLSDLQLRLSDLTSLHDIVHTQTTLLDGYSLAHGILCWALAWAVFGSGCVVATSNDGSVFFQHVMLHNEWLALMTFVGVQSSET